MDENCLWHYKTTSELFIESLLFRLTLTLFSFTEKQVNNQREENERATFQIR